MIKKTFQVNDNLFYADNPHVEKNVFITKTPDKGELPLYSDIKEELPKPVFEGHEDIINCYYKAWEIAFGNLRKANPKAGFVSDFIDTAFNGYLFMWDSAFIVMFGKYAEKIFNFQKTLDNFYSHQHRDGFICREICEEVAGEQFTRDDPASTGPNILAWCEWEYFSQTGDIKRLGEVFYPLLAYHEWLRENRSWPDGSYFSSGLACGMDVQPRLQKGHHLHLSHGFMSWIDACAQGYLSADCLIKMAKVLGIEEKTESLKKEKELLEKTINNTMWSEKDGFYYDKYRDGSQSSVKTVGAYWTLLAGLVPNERVKSFVLHLENKNEFSRKSGIPSLSADHPEFAPEGNYWYGSVWAPTSYMVLKGLEKHGFDSLAHNIACRYLDCVVSVYNETGTLFENYAPDFIKRGSHSKSDFVGWTGLVPISILFEYVLGIRPDAQKSKITWHINKTEGHGVKNYPLGKANVSLYCAPRTSADKEPNITITSDLPVSVEIIWNGKTKIVKA